jgi:hypothetical protein
MSGLGQERTSSSLEEIPLTAQKATSFDHLVRAREYRRRDFNTKRFRGL